MADVVETEWQFEAPDLERVRAWIESQPPHAPLRFEQTRDREQIDGYFDTADWRLFHAGLSLRRRQTGESYELTLKSLGTSSNGPVARREITEASPDGRIPGAGGPVSERVLLIAGRRALQPLFDVRTRRRSFAVSRDGVQVATIELDETTVEPPS
ncbi:MAG: CYTH domain-containing protein, partial [Dehalococcoidia bacterium]